MMSPGTAVESTEFSVAGVALRIGARPSRRTARVVTVPVPRFRAAVGIGQSQFDFVGRVGLHVEDAAGEFVRPGVALVGAGRDAPQVQPLRPIRIAHPAVANADGCVQVVVARDEPFDGDVVDRREGNDSARPRCCWPGPGELRAARRGADTLRTGIVRTCPFLPRSLPFERRSCDAHRRLEKKERSVTDGLSGAEGASMPEYRLRSPAPQGAQPRTAVITPALPCRRQLWYSREGIPIRSVREG